MTDTIWQKIVHDRLWRKRQIRYWLQDPFWGGLNFCCHYLFRLLPLDAPCKIGALLGPWAARLRFQTADERADYNLKCLRPELSDAERRELLRLMWRNIGQTLSEYPINDLLWRDGRVSVENGGVIERCRAAGRPIVFVTVHLGNWEVISGYFVDRELPLLSLYQPERNRFVDKIARISRRRIGADIVAAGPHALRALCKHLAAGKPVWLAIDEYKNAQVWGPRFGRELPKQTRNAEYAVRLAQRFNAAIIPYRTDRKPASRFQVTFAEPIIVGDDAATALAQLDDLTAAWVKAQPEHWYMLHLLRWA